MLCSSIPPPVHPVRFYRISVYRIRLMPDLTGSAQPAATGPPILPSPGRYFCAARRVCTASSRFSPAPARFMRLVLLFLVAALAAGPATAQVPARTVSVDGETDAPRPAFLQTLGARYAEQDTSGVERLCSGAEAAEERLLCRYRLYPMTLDAAHLAAIPDPVTRSARERALLAALWAYRTAAAPAWRVPGYGIRSDRLLGEARALDAADPYVLLVEGQGLLYKPRLFGGDPRAALDTFRRLRERLARTADASASAGVSLWEADIWVWMALRTLAPESAARERDRLLAAAPPPLFRQFLIDPP